MKKEKAKLFAVWGDTPNEKKRKMYKTGSIVAIDGTEIPYGYIENSNGIQYTGELYSIIERDGLWKLVQPKNY